MILLFMKNLFPVFFLVNILLHVVVDVIHLVEVCVGELKSFILLVLTVIQNILI